MTKGKVWLVGAGPSDAGLLTLKAKRALDMADVVLYDSLVGDAVLALVPPGTRTVDVGKRAGRASTPQDEINALILDEARKGNAVVRLKGGDPLLFGRGGEELEFLSRHGVPFEVVPGVTSALAVPAYAGIPVTHRDYCSSVHIIAGHTKCGDFPEIDFSALARLGGTLVFLMGFGALGRICEGLLNAGMDASTPAAVIENGTSADQRKVVSTLSSLPDEACRQGVKAPAVVIVGRVCELAGALSWAENRPLSGARVVVTRPRELSASLSARLEDLGAEVVEIPAIKTAEVEDSGQIASALKNLRRYSWVVLTSRTGADIFFGLLRKNRVDMRALYGLKFAAIGPSTAAAVEERGVFVDCVPERHDSVGLACALEKAVRPGEKLLIPRSRIGSEDLVRHLDKCGIEYDDIPTYDTVADLGGPLSAGEILSRRRVDFVTFTSASTVRGFAQAAQGCDLRSFTAVCIGEQTAKEANFHGMNAVVSDTVSADGIVDAIVRLHAKARSQKEAR